MSVECRPAMLSANRNVGSRFDSDDNSMQTARLTMDERASNLKHSDLLYDYIKFHLGLYIATPPVLAIVGTALGVSGNRYFQIGMIGLIAVYFVAGVHASLSLANVINVSWQDD